MGLVLCLLGQRSEDALAKKSPRKPAENHTITQFKYQLSRFPQLLLTSQMLGSIFSTTVETLSSCLKLSSTLGIKNLNYNF